MKNKILVLILVLISVSKWSFAKEVTIKVTGQYFNGDPSEIVYYADGNKIAKEKFDVKGNVTKTEGQIPDGIAKKYYLLPGSPINGTLKAEINLKNGLLNGPMKEYSESGCLKSEINYRNGIRHGETKIYWKDTNVVSLIDTYENGRIVDKKMYDVSGNLTFEQKF